MNIPRKLKINKLGIDNLSIEERNIVNFVNSKLVNLSEFKLNNFKDWVFYMDNESQCIFDYNTKNKHFRIRYNDFWEVLEYKYKLKHFDICQLIQHVVRNIYGFETTVISYKPSIFTDSVESMYKGRIIS